MIPKSDAGKESAFAFCNSTLWYHIKVKPFFKGLKKGSDFPFSMKRAKKSSGKRVSFGDSCDLKASWERLGKVEGGPI